MTTTQDELIRLVRDQTGCDEIHAVEALNKTGDLVDAIYYLEYGHIPKKPIVRDSSQYDWIKHDGYIISSILKQSNDSSLREKGILMDQYLSNITIRSFVG